MNGGHCSVDAGGESGLVEAASKSYFQSVSNARNEPVALELPRNVVETLMREAQ